MSSNAARKLNLLRTVGRGQGHDEGITEKTEDGDKEREIDDINIEKLDKGIKFFGDNFFSMFVSMLTGKRNRLSSISKWSIAARFQDF